jgi:uncharacterized protein (DUF1330 family)
VAAAPTSSCGRNIVQGANHVSHCICRNWNACRNRHRRCRRLRTQCSRQGPRRFAIVDISEITDPATFKTLLPIAGKANDQFGGKFIARTENVVALDGMAPKRFVVIAFESMDKAKAWDKSPLQNEVNAIRKKSTKSRTYLVDGELQ